MKQEESQKMENNNQKPWLAARNGQIVAGIVITLIGTAFLLQREFQLQISHLILPALIIGLGLWLLVSNRRPGHRNASMYAGEPGVAGQAGDLKNGGDVAFFRTTALFSEQRKIVATQPLRGGDIVNIFGGTDVNLLQATLEGPIVIEIFQLFGGTKIVVPANWDLHSEVISVFGEVDDRRFNPEIPKDKGQVVYLKGTSIFGGVTIKSM